MVGKEINNAYFCINKQCYCYNKGISYEKY